MKKMADALNLNDSVILQLNSRFYAPGHNSAVLDNSNQDWMFYHVIDTTNSDGGYRRVLCMDPINYNGNGQGWPIVGNGTPSTTPQNGPNVN